MPHRKRLLTKLQRPSPSSLILPRVGPFASLAATPVSSLSDRTIVSAEDVTTNSRTSPLKYKTLTFPASSTLEVNWSALSTSQIFIWSNVLILGQGAQISANGEAGGDAVNLCCTFVVGGAGGRGGSGGGGGGATGSAFAMGGDGGTGVSGSDGESRLGQTGGPGGTGYGTGYNGGYSYGSGGDGTTTGGAMLGAGGNGFGGGGAGGSGGGCCGNVAGGGGGGGGGLIVLVCNWFQPDVCACGINTSGGLGGFGLGSGGDQGGNGGDGVIWVATKRFDPGAGIGLAFNGNASFFEITAANTLVARTLADSWNNT